jgi:hypothetical protein
LHPGHPFEELGPEYKSEPETPLSGEIVFPMMMVPRFSASRKRTVMMSHTRRKKT